MAIKLKKNITSAQKRKVSALEWINEIISYATCFGLTDLIIFD